MQLMLVYLYLDVYYFHWFSFFLCLTPTSGISAYMGVSLYMEERNSFLLCEIYPLDFTKTLLMISLFYYLICPFFSHFVCLKISLFLSSLFLKAIFSGHRVLRCSYFLSAHEGIIPLSSDFQCCCWVLCCQSHCHSFESNLSSVDAFMILSLLLGFFSFTMLCILTDFLIFTVCGDSLIFLNLYIGVFHLLWKIPKH